MALSDCKQSTMISTSKFTFMHLHKTGGQSITDALLHCIRDAEQIGYHLPLRLLPEQAKSRPIIGVIRNPWDWYVSWYAFNNLRGVKNPLFNIVSRGKQAGFHATIKNLARYPEATARNETMKRSHKALLPEKFENDGGAGFTKRCVNEFDSPTEGYYSLLVRRMLGDPKANIHLIRFESLEQDLIEILQKLNVPETETSRSCRISPGKIAPQRTLFSVLRHRPKRAHTRERKRPYSAFWLCLQLPRNTGRVNQYRAWTARKKGRW